MKKILLIFLFCSFGYGTIIHDTAITYTSTINPLTLKYDFSYNNTLINKPLVIIGHGWSLSRTSVTAAWKERLINNYNVCILSVDMRGRTTSQGVPDGNARELY